ncbi:MAG: hypothetical protein ACR2FR_09625 [Rubrobacter sp.]|jgi:hypothetical protein|nr:hypothetical protein [Rubrobacteraceae bacterium]MDQ3251221.1 hypothetical protein [Actinomycetota bacterium]MDQ3436507.1 hypothetical protein [Actinomycetota bacterium]
MSYLFDLETVRQRQEDLLSEARERRIARALRNARRGVEGSRRGVRRELEDVGRGLAEEPTVAVSCYRP